MREIPQRPQSGRFRSDAAVALATECREELGLSQKWLAGLRQIGAHDQALLPTPSGFSDVEYQMVYRARLTREGWLHASAADHEVAAIAAFSRSDLAAMLREHADRVAPGLAAAFSRYVDPGAAHVVRGGHSGG